MDKKSYRDGIGRDINSKLKFLYEGEFKNNKAHGYGRVIYNNGNAYIGEVQNGEMFGFGTVYFFTGKYKGRTLKGEYVRSRCVNKCVWGKLNFDDDNE